MIKGRPAERSKAEASSTPVSLRELFAFFLPLALTHMMMSGGTPIVNAGIARCPDPVEGLAAFAVAFSFSVFLNSLCFGLEPAVVALGRGVTSLGKLTRMAALLGVGLALIEFTIGMSPLAQFIFTRVFGLEAALAHRAAVVVVAFSPIPFFLSLRSVGRGMLTTISRTNLVGWATLLRLLGMILVVVFGINRLEIDGALLGALAFNAGVLAETLFVIVCAIRRLDELPDEEDGEDEIGYGAIVSFVAPLLVSMLFAVSLAPIMNAVISRTNDAEVAVSSFSVVRSIAWFVAFMLVAFQQTVIARGRSREDALQVARFACLVAGGLSLTLMLLAFTPLGRLIMAGAIGVKGQVLEASVYTLMWAPLLPPFLALRAYLRGMAVRDGRTGMVLHSSIVSLLVATVAGLLLKEVLAVGALVAMLMLLTAQATEACYLLAFVRYRNSRKNQFADVDRVVGGE